jgi:hypothetical protein
MDGASNRGRTDDLLITNQHRMPQNGVIFEFGYFLVALRRTEAHNRRIKG